MSQVNQPLPHDTNSEKEKIPSSEASLLFQPTMIWLFLACLVLAIWFKFLPLIIVFSFSLILCLWITLWRKKALTKLNLKLELSKSRLFAEEEFIAYASIKNNKWLPLLWIEWELPANDQFIWNDKHKGTYCIRFLGLLSYQQISWTINGKSLRRGVFPIGQVTIRSGDGFRFSEKEHVHQLNQTLYIYPKLIPVQVPAFRPSMQWHVKGKKGGFLEDPLLISGIRDYEAGDEWQRLNWRAMARTGKMQTNVYQPIVAEQLLIYVDVQGFLIYEKFADDIEKQHKYVLQKKEGFEYFLSVIASFAVAYQKQDIAIGYMSNALDHTGKKQQIIPPLSQITPLLDQLAQITQRIIHEKVSPLDEISYHGQQSVPQFIFCEEIMQEHYLWYERNKRKFDIHFYYVNQSEYAVKLTKVAKPMDMLLRNQAVNES